MGKLVYTILVLSIFADKDNRNVIHQPGEKLLTDDLCRVNDIIKRGLGELSAVKVEELKATVDADSDGQKSEKMVIVGGVEYELCAVKSALNAIGVKTAANAGVENVSQKVASLNEEQAIELNSKLSE